MKLFYLKPMLTLLIAVLWSAAEAGSISGTISYAGSAPGAILITASTDSTYASFPNYIVMLDTVGGYSIQGMTDGTYYIMATSSKSFDFIQVTDPWGYYGTSEHWIPVIISGTTDVSGINITLLDGTVDYKNPFHKEYIPPTQTIQLPATTQPGRDGSIACDGSLIYLYKHDSSGAAGAKIYVIDPVSGNVVSTHILSLESTPNHISWIDQLVFIGTTLWATGGYGDPSGIGVKEGVFILNVDNTTASNQIPLDTSITLKNELATDGTYMYVVVDSMGAVGIVKFKPGEVTKVSPSFFIKLPYSPASMCYGNGYLWMGIDSVRKVDPVSGMTMVKYNFPISSAQLYLNGMLWMYDKNDNTLKTFSLLADAVVKHPDPTQPSDFKLSQNYPNPFNPSTTISFSLPTRSFVSLKVFDALGREVSTIVSEEMNANTYSRIWNGDGMPSGVYFYRLQAGSFSETNKLLLLR